MVEVADTLGVPVQKRGILAGKGQSVWVEDASVEGGKREVTPKMCLGKEVPAAVSPAFRNCFHYVLPVEKRRGMGRKKRRTSRTDSTRSRSFRQVTLVIDCPTPAHIDQLVSNPIWEKYQAANEDGIYPVHLVWHRWGTWETDERYQTWLNSFGPDVQVSVALFNTSGLECLLYC
jgi:hypothetical protein